MILSFVKTNVEKISQSIVSYITPYIKKTDEKIDEPQENPTTLKLLEYEKYFLKMIASSPINFILMTVFIAICVLVYASNIVYNLIGMVYPIIYGLYLFENNKETDENTIYVVKLGILNRYWILFMLIMILEYFLYPILQFVPLYSLAKIIFIFMLVRNDFLLANYVFDFLKSGFKNIEQKIQINELIEKIKSQ